jgi:esterase/lipase
VKELTRLLAKDSKLQDVIGKDKDKTANFKLDTLIKMKD